jgi:spermidine synthase
MKPQSVSQSALNNKQSRAQLAAVVACFVLSGFAALIYQVAWIRQFSVVFGTSELAVATVLSSYMGGLALGATIAGRWVARVRRPILVYGLLEGGIAVSALCVPWLLQLASALHISILGDQPQPVSAGGLGQSVFYLAVAFVVLLIPTACMGATLPLLTKSVVRTQEQIGRRVGMLYASNTLGAVAGTLVAGFILLPALGLSGTVWTGAAVNAVIFAVIVAMVVFLKPEALLPKSKASSTDRLVESPSHDIKQTRFHFIGTGKHWILPLMLLSGANTFLYEVLWTRLLSHILGGSVAAFSVMLASFLSGIAIGSVLSAYLANSAKRSLLGFIAVQCGIALSSALIFKYLHLLIPDQAGLTGNLWLAILILLPATLFIGATFPFAVRLLAKHADEAAPASARVYAWNTMGSIVGAAAAGFWLIPLLKYEGAIKLAVVINIFIALAASLFIVKTTLRRLAAPLGLLLGVVFVVYPVLPPWQILVTSPVSQSRDGKIRYYAVGRSATVLLVEQGGYINLRTNGLPEASANLKGAPPYQHNQRLLSTLPVLARPQTKNMLIVGLGAGVVAEKIPPTVESIDIIELESKVVEANRLIASEREINPLADPRVSLTINDARSALALTSKAYDAIVSQPSHPWTAGASHLYTREFMQLAKNHLRPKGVYLQWMHNQFMTPALLKSLAATMVDVFDHVRVYQWHPEVLFFLGSDSPLTMEKTLAATGVPLRDHPVHYLEKGIGSVEDLIVALLMDEKNVRRFAEGAPILTDNHNRMATESAKAMDAGTTISFADFVELTLPYNPLLQIDSWIHQDLAVPIAFPYISQRLTQRGFKQHAIELSRVLQRSRNPEALLLIGAGLEAQGDRHAAQKTLLTAYKSSPGSRKRVQAALVKPWLSSLADGRVPEHLVSVVNDLTVPVAAVVAGWKAAREKQWSRLVELDSQLARVRSTDLLYLEAVKLRADWRMKVTSPGYQPRLALQAMQLIDNAIALFHDPDFYNLRLAAAVIADRPNEVMETARRLIHIFDGEVNRAEQGRSQYNRKTILRKLRQVDVVRRIVDQLQGSPDIPGYKVKDLNQQLNLIETRLKTINS